MYVALTNRLIYNCLAPGRTAVICWANVGIFCLQYCWSNVFIANSWFDVDPTYVLSPSSPAYANVMQIILIRQCVGATLVRHYYLVLYCYS